MSSSQLAVRLHKPRVREAAVISVLFNAGNIFASHYFFSIFSEFRFSLLIREDKLINIVSRLM